MITHGYRLTGALQSPRRPYAKLGFVRLNSPAFLKKGGAAAIDHICNDGIRVARGEVQEGRLDHPKWPENGLDERAEADVLQLLQAGGASCSRIGPLDNMQ